MAWNPMTHIKTILMASLIVFSVLVLSVRGTASSFGATGDKTMDDYTQATLADPSLRAAHVLANAQFRRVGLGATDSSLVAAVVP